MSITVDTIRTLIYTLVPDLVALCADPTKLSTLDTYINFSFEDVNQEAFGTSSSRAIAYLTLYNIYDVNALPPVTNTVAVGGTLTKVKKKNDRVETDYSYGNNSMRHSSNDSMYLSNKWGKKFLEIRNTISVSGAFIV